MDSFYVNAKNKSISIHFDINSFYLIRIVSFVLIGYSS